MARLTVMPQQAIIDGLAGKIDFYMYKGQAVARKWPYWKTRTPTLTEKAAQERFAYVNQVAKTLPQFVIEQYQRMAQGTPFSWKDLLVRSYISGIKY